MTLAWRNLSHDRTRFVVTILGIGFALFLMTFQGSLLAGFLRAASSVIDATDADLWITARGVPCFDFATPLPDRFGAVALGVAGVRTGDPAEKSDRDVLEVMAEMDGTGEGLVVGLRVTVQFLAQ